MVNGGSCSPFFYAPGEIRVHLRLFSGRVKFDKTALGRNRVLNSNPNFADLLPAAVSGDSDSLVRLLLDYQQPLGRKISNLVAEKRLHVTADDVLQETYFRVFQDVTNFRGSSEGEFYSWLKTIAANVAGTLAQKQNALKRGGDFVRREKRNADFEKSAIMLVDELTGAVETPSRFLAKREAIDALQIAMGALPEHQLEAIRLHCFERRTLEETATIMQKTPAAVHGLIQRGKKSLRE